MRQVWTLAGLMRTKKLPEVQKLLIGGSDRQSASEQLQVLHMLSKRYGGSVTTVQGHG